MKGLEEFDYLNFDKISKTDNTSYKLSWKNQSLIANKNVIINIKFYNAKIYGIY